MSGILSSSKSNKQNRDQKTPWVSSAGFTYDIPHGLEFENPWFSVGS